MKGELYKEEEGYYVFVNTVILGTTRPLLNLDLVKYKLSLDNCEDIERDVPKNELDGWDVWVEMENSLCNGYKNQPDNVIGFIAEYKSVPKLDEDGCLILTKNII
jgi:hypothetical protein